MESKQNRDVLTPILVTGMGRSGSTLVMQLLATDASCVMDQIYPLESRYLSQIVYSAAQWDGRTFTEYGEPSSAHQTIIGSNPFALRGKNPLESLLTVPGSDEMFLALWRQFSASVRSGNAQARFYAEKVVEWIPAFIGDTINSHTLFLFRDPRDLFLSANSFNSKRGYLAFGRQEADSDRDHALTMASRYLHRYENYRALKKSGAKVSLIRYEDVALNPVSALAELSAATGLNIRPLADDTAYAHHRTTASVNQSIARWKREPLSQDVLDAIDEVLGDVLEELGYETSARPESSSWTGEQLRRRIGEIENAQVTTTDGEGLSLICETDPLADGDERSVSLMADIKDVGAKNISEIWLCLSGSFGGSCSLERLDDAGSVSFAGTQKYDVGAHATTLRFKLADAGFAQTSRLKLTIKHAGTQLRGSEPATIKLRRLVLVPGNSAVMDANTDEAGKNSSLIGKFFDQFLRA